MEGSPTVHQDPNWLHTKQHGQLPLGMARGEHDPSGQEEEDEAVEAGGMKGRAHRRSTREREGDGEGAGICCPGCVLRCQPALINGLPSSSAPAAFLAGEEPPGFLP